MHNEVHDHKPGKIQDNIIIIIMSHHHDHDHDEPSCRSRVLREGIPAVDEHCHVVVPDHHHDDCHDDNDDHRSQSSQVS